MSDDSRQYRKNDAPIRRFKDMDDEHENAGTDEFAELFQDSLTRTLVYAVGPGLRYLTPVGPARIDFGYQLNRIANLKVNGQPETRPWRIHFSIGQAF